MKNLLFLSPGWPLDYRPNGIVAYVTTMIEGMKSLNVNSYVITGRILSGRSADKNVFTFLPPKKESKTLFQKIYYRLSPYRAKHSIFESKCSKCIKAIDREVKIDILEMEESFGHSYYIQRELSIPVIVRLHGPWFLNGKALDVPEDKDFFRRIRYEKQALANAVGVTSPSKDVLDQTREYYGLELKNAVVIPCPPPITPDEKHWKWEKCNPYQIAFIGRFDYHKGGDIVIDAFRYILEQDERISLCFAGPDRGIIDDNGVKIQIGDYIQKAFPDATKRGKIQVLGTLNQKELQDLRLNSFLTIIASRYDNFPYTVLEAMSQGCPIVAANVGGVPEIVIDGYSGLLFEPGNAKDLATKILKLIENKSLAIELATNARQECQSNLSLRSIASQTLEYYHEVQRQFNYNQR